MMGRKYKIKYGRENTGKKSLFKIYEEWQLTSMKSAASLVDVFLCKIVPKQDYSK